ncbi:MAG: ABC transporter ATP-binding protein/permease [Pseudomonadota bacterium]|nr:ABC transporter ATP-binding protein/permease [Pseudomonadota bacterium]
MIRGIWKLYANLWRYAEGRRASLLRAFGFLTTAEVLRLTVPWLAGDAMNAVQRSGAAGLPHAARDLLLVFAAIVCGWAAHAPGRILERNVALHARAAFTMDLLRRLLRAPLAWHRKQHSAETTHRVLQSTDALHQFAENQYVYLQNTILLVGPLIALWLLSPWVGLLAAVGFATLSLVSISFDRRLVALSVLRNDLERRHNIAWVDIFANLLTVYSLRRFKGVETLIRARLMGSFVPLRRIVLLNEAKWASVDVLGALLWCFLVALYATLAIRGRGGQAGTAGQAGLAIGSVYMVYEYARRIETVMSVIAGDFAQLAGQHATFVSAEPIFTALQCPRVERINASSWAVLSLDHVTFRHEGDVRNHVVLDDISLSLGRGKRYALVGPSGAGKSTLLGVLSGLESAHEGEIRRDGLALTPEQLRAESTLIPQEAQLFVGTIAENLTLGEKVSDRSVAAALAMACAGEFVGQLPEGTAAMVSEGGANRSGGERQRLALARGALAALGSSLVLLDEPTSKLDPESEARVLQGLLSGFPRSTIVMALHRTQLLHRFDAVILMENGRVVDVGSADELSERSMQFRKLVAASSPSGQVFDTAAVATSESAEPHVRQPQR